MILAQFGLNIICVDTNKEKIEKLKNGEVPIYEPGLEDLLIKNIEEKRIEFTTDIEYAVKNSRSTVYSSGNFLPQMTGIADLKYVLEVAESIGKHMEEYKVIVDKSTVPVGT